jgi:hypothetical protein
MKEKDMVGQGCGRLETRCEKDGVRDRLNLKGKALGHLPLSAISIIRGPTLFYFFFLWGGLGGIRCTTAVMANLKLTCFIYQPFFFFNTEVYQKVAGSSTSSGNFKVDFFILACC